MKVSINSIQKKELFLWLLCNRCTRFSKQGHPWLHILKYILLNKLLLHLLESLEVCISFYWWGQTKLLGEEERRKGGKENVCYGEGCCCDKRDKDKWSQTSLNMFTSILYCPLLEKLYILRVRFEISQTSKRYEVQSTFCSFCLIWDKFCLKIDRS